MKGKAQELLRKTQGSLELEKSKGEYTMGNDLFGYHVAHFRLVTAQPYWSSFIVYVIILLHVCEACV